MTMTLALAESTVNHAWDHRDALNERDHTSAQAAVDTALNALDSGQARIATRSENGDWAVHEWLKKAVLLSFRFRDMRLMPDGAIKPHDQWWDKIPLKTEGWKAEDFTQAGFRMVPRATVRHGAYVAPGAVLMPSYVNIGAYVGEATMVDTWATVGSCAQIGKNVHLSGGVGIGGVLEPLQAAPTIIEDDCFIGARSEIAEGVIVRQGAVIAMGVFISASTKIVDRESGEVTYGEVPAGSVVVPGTLPDKKKKSRPSLACAVIVKRVDAQTRAKTSINELLRD